MRKKKVNLSRAVGYTTFIICNFVSYIYHKIYCILTLQLLVGSIVILFRSKNNTRNDHIQFNVASQKSRTYFIFIMLLLFHPHNWISFYWIFHFLYYGWLSSTLFILLPTNNNSNFRKLITTAPRCRGCFIFRQDRNVSHIKCYNNLSTNENSCYQLYLTSCSCSTPINNTVLYFEFWDRCRPVIGSDFHWKTNSFIYRHLSMA